MMEPPREIPGLPPRLHLNLAINVLWLERFYRPAMAEGDEEEEQLDEIDSFLWLVEIELGDRTILQEYLANDYPELIQLIIRDVIEEKLHGDDHLPPRLR